MCLKSRCPFGDARFGRSGRYLSCSFETPAWVARVCGQARSRPYRRRVRILPCEMLVLPGDADGSRERSASASSISVIRRNFTGHRGGVYSEPGFVMPKWRPDIWSWRQVQNAGSFRPPTYMSHRLAYSCAPSIHVSRLAGGASVPLGWLKSCCQF
jgi:hypothetical protein